MGCIESERRALLRLKKDLKDPSNRLASWNGDGGDCCNWAGVVCHNFTSHVLELHLGNPHLIRYYSTSSDDEYEAFERSKLVGKLNPYLLDFKQLIYLNLSGNHFERTKIPTYLGSLRNLKYLDLSYAGFEGMIPQQLGNLSNLQHLDLGYNYYYQLYVDNLLWLSSLSSLKHLNLSYANLANAFDWLTVVNSLPSLVELRLSGCELQYFLPLPIANLSSLVTLDLSFNSFTGRIPQSIGAMRALESIDLSTNQFDGEIPQSISNLTFLSYLNFSNNNLIGKIPLSTQMQSFEASSFTGNKLCGAPLPKNCIEIVPPTPGIKTGNEDKVDWLSYVSLAVVFIVGFLCVIGSFLINRRWRYMYCHFLDCLRDKHGSVVRKCNC